MTNKLSFDKIVLNLHPLKIYEMKLNLSIMKIKFLFLITFVLCSFARINAQTNPQLWGMTTHGGGDSTGTIFHINGDGSGMANIHDFGSPKGNTPYGDLLLASNGMLYGMTSNGGAYNAGVIFSFDTSTNTMTALHHFNPNKGGYPFGALIQDTNGILYGMTNSGGLNNLGVIFSFDYNTNIYTDLWDLKPFEGEYPYGSLLKANNGLLYGLTSNGGNDSVGTLFSYNINLDTLIVLKSFDTIANAAGTGGQPHSSLIQANDGKLYGVARNNGAHGWGTIFNWDIGANTFTKIYDFTGIDGLYPYGSLIQGSDNLLYGMTQGFLSNPQDGSIYSINPVNFTFLSRYSFYVLHIGNPFGSLHQASNGTMYGMTFHGVEGTGDTSGVIFNFYPSIDSVSVLHQFNSSTGNYTQGSLIYANNKYYGMTSQGGAFNSGTIFKFDTLGNIYNDLYDFYGGNDGNSPYGTLVPAGNGLLYGMTEFGGKNGKGTIFSVNPSNNNYASLYSFDGIAHGSYPTGSFLLANDGNLYGTTQFGGANNAGTVFIFSISGDSVHVCDKFDSVGGVPSSAMIQGADGYLYGVTSGHGIGDFGQLYRYDLALGSLHTILYFNTTAIGYPWGSLVQASNGKLYGMTCKGSSSNVGSLFSYDLTTSTSAIIHTFNLSVGGNPFGNLIQANDGNLYGLSQFGGDQGHGSLFRLNPSNDSIKVMHSFHYQFPKEGNYPLGSLIQSRNGKLYGMTCFGAGSDSSGIIFNYDIFNHTYTQMLAFNITNGANPTYNNFFELGTGTSCFAYFAVYPNPVGSHNYKIVNLSTGIPPVTYLWDFGDGNTSTSQYPTHVYASIGDYQVCLTINDSAGCQNTYCDSVLSADTINIMSPIVAGVPTITNNQNTIVSLYPNPFSNSCTIRFDGNNLINAELKVYDLLGQEVKSVYLGSNKQIILNRDNLPSGMYFYRLIQNKTEVISNGKFVIE